MFQETAVHFVRSW